MELRPGSVCIPDGIVHGLRQLFKIGNAFRVSCFSGLRVLVSSTSGMVSRQRLLTRPCAYIPRWRCQLALAGAGRRWPNWLDLETAV